MTLFFAISLTAVMFAPLCLSATLIVADALGALRAGERAPAPPRAAYLVARAARSPQRDGRADEAHLSA